MDEQQVGSLTDGGFKAEVFSTQMPGEFKVIYRDPSGKVLAEAPLTGISSYKQREHEIAEQLHEFAHGDKPAKTPYQGDPGEY